LFLNTPVMNKEPFSHTAPLNIPKPLGQAAVSVEEADLAAARIGFPVLIRPSHVLGGRAMVIVYGRDESVLQDALQEVV